MQHCNLQKRILIILVRFVEAGLGPNHRDGNQGECIPDRVPHCKIHNDSETLSIRLKMLHQVTRHLL